ncbi:MAG TPA: hypothetical protein VHL53_13860, partial [Acidimicrobiia bacterium]|nr:hypothetical protein [Acidimicrobiia bacterium]
MRIDAAALRQSAVAGLRRHLGPRRHAATMVGAVLAVAGSNLAWATFFFGYPGKMSLSGFPGGARAYALALVLPALAGLTRLPGRRAAAIAGGSGVLGIAGGNLVAIAKQGGGLGAVAGGAWLAVAGGLVLCLA